MIAPVAEPKRFLTSDDTGSNLMGARGTSGRAGFAAAVSDCALWIRGAAVLLRGVKPSALRKRGSGGNWSG